ncbi:hypothetical protein BDZ45DRAFT_672054 [Acephala macrosclerotiorum]|nr:hypothetical protein BDZ45DRAFT_672054 [Acephala macrosclerotiorum]
MPFHKPHPVLIHASLACFILVPFLGSISICQLNFLIFLQRITTKSSLAGFHRLHRPNPKYHPEQNER